MAGTTPITAVTGGVRRCRLEREATERTGDDRCPGRCPGSRRWTADGQPSEAPWVASEERPLDEGERDARGQALGRLNAVQALCARGDRLAPRRRRRRDDHG